MIIKTIRKLYAAFQLGGFRYLYYIVRDKLIKEDCAYRYMLRICENADPEDIPGLLELYYVRITGQKLDLNNPQTFNEKIQWIKLYDSTPIKTKLADKYLVREWICEQIGDKYLIPLLGVWDRFEDIDFDSLPNRFVLKANHGSGMNILVKDKEQFDVEKALNRFCDWMSMNFAFSNGYELQYKDIPRRIIAEKYLNHKDGREVYDYKVFVFDGKALMVQVDIDRFQFHRRNLYDTDWNYIHEWILYPNASEVHIEKPKPLKEMIDLSEKLGKMFCLVRVDWYICDEKLYFGEMTFTPDGGFGVFSSEEFAQELGAMIDLPNKYDYMKLNRHI